MSGPIIRSGASELFSQNWGSIFGKKSSGKGTATKAKPAKKSAKPAAKKKAAKKKK
jgi:hypothetical protein